MNAIKKLFVILRSGFTICKNWRARWKSQYKARLKQKMCMVKMPLKHPHQYNNFEY